MAFICKSLLLSCGYRGGDANKKFFFTPFFPQNWQMDKRMVSELLHTLLFRLELCLSRYVLLKIASEKLTKNNLSFK